MADLSRHKSPDSLGEALSDHIELHNGTQARPSSAMIHGLGRGGHETEESLPLVKAVKRYPKVAAYCLGLSVAIIGWGYGLVVVGSVTAVDTFRRDFGAVYKGQLIIPSVWLSLWLALPPAAAAVGSVVGGWLGDRIGRKFTLMVGSIVSAAAVAIIFFSRLTESKHGRQAMLTAGLTVQGFSVGLIKVTSVTYVSEITPKALRGPAMGLFPTFTLLGQLIGAIVVFLINDIENESGYLGAFGSIWVLALALFILSCFIPDTPARLIRKGAHERALVSSKRLYAPRVDPYKALEETVRTIREEESLEVGITYISCFKGTNLRRTLLVIMANVLPAIFGLEFLSNGSYFTTVAGLPSSNALMLMIGGIIAGILANLSGIWVLSRWGRRRVMMVSMSVAGILWCVIGASGFWRGLGAAWLAGGLLIAIIVTCGMGCWPASYAVMGETSSLRLRSSTQGVGGVATQAASTTMAVILPYVFNPDAAALEMKTAFIFCGLCLVAVGVTWVVLPEMKDRSMQEIDRMFELRLPARQFKSWKGDGTAVVETA